MLRSRSRLSERNAPHMAETINQTGFGSMNSVPARKPEQGRALSRRRRSSSTYGCHRLPDLPRRAHTSPITPTPLSVALAEARLHGLLSGAGVPRGPWPHLATASAKTQHPYEAARPQRRPPALTVPLHRGAPSEDVRQRLRPSAGPRASNRAAPAAGSPRMSPDRFA